jgi:hypothetical protein
MPLFQYFGWVGSMLLAALFAVSWWLPGKIPAPASDSPLDGKITIRIHTGQKWPESVQFDTSRSLMGAAANTAPTVDVAADRRSADVRSHDPFEAFAEVPAGASKPCFRPPCVTANGRHLVIGDGLPRSDRSRVSTPARFVTFPNRLHKPPGRS